MKKRMTIVAVGAAFLIVGCTATKIEFEKNKDGDTKYSIWHNDHWMKTSTERMAGGMNKDGLFTVELAGRDSSPSEEFNRTMQTYTTAFVQLAQIAAAAYNPSASGAIQSAASKQSAASASPVQVEVVAAPAEAVQAPSTNATDCADGSCTNGAACTDGSCEVKPAETK